MTIMSESKNSNRLIHEKSPYLLQHAHNPVDWYPWGEEAFSKAKEENKPIFLSIGYSTCHWCHVMEKESFEDEEVAELMNEAFVNIKVDREERPDIDKTYMQVAQMITGRGGWPLTIIMTPEKEPFFASTYIPKKGRFNQSGMLDLIPQIQELWKNGQTRISDVTSQIKQALKQKPSTMGEGRLDRSIIEDAFHTYSQRFDEENGGFGRAPKFPSPHNLIFLLRYWNRSKDPWALHMVEKTLEKMRFGGIFDHIGYGFHRYSTDAHWLVPHFEKMLYDQAMLIMAYTEAYHATKREEFAETVHEVIDYLQRDMMDEGGAFYSAEDADSEGEEGKFYVWTKQEIESVLTREEAEFFAKAYNISENGNFRDEATQKRTGANIPHLRHDEEKTAEQLGLDFDSYVAVIDRIRIKLLEVRATRVRPHLDDKILTDWNGLTIAALARAGRVIGIPHFVTLAEKALNFILSTMREDEGKLLHRYRDNEADVEAFLDDYAFLIWGLIELYESTFKPKYMRLGLELAHEMVEKFQDDEKGGFYFSSHDSEELLIRNKDGYDGAIPSGNSAAALDLVRLSRLTGETSLEDMAEQTVRSFAVSISNSGAGFSWMLTALDYMLGPSYEVVITGSESDNQTEKMLDALRTHYMPTKVVIHKPGGRTNEEVAEIAPYTRYYDAVNSKATAHVCIEHNCKLPTNNVSKMIDLLSSEGVTMK
jgi:hypothetical protein